MASVDYDAVKMLGPVSLYKEQRDGDWYLILKQDFRVTSGGAPVPQMRLDNVSLTEEWSGVPQNIKDSIVAIFSYLETGAGTKVGL